jgi:hypothetical protein
VSEEEKARPITKPVSGESSSTDERKGPQEVENTDKGTGGLSETPPAGANSAEPKKAGITETNAASSESSGVGEHKGADETENEEKDTRVLPVLSKLGPGSAENAEAEKDTRVLPVLSQLKPSSTEPEEAESAEEGAGTSPEISAEEAYFAQLEKDDTLVKKPKTLPIIDQPELERSVRWGSVFLGKSAMLALRIKGRQEPIHVEITGRCVIGRVHPRSDERPDLDLNKYGAFFHGVSREHVAITKDGNLLQIEDLGSTNGTYLNGMKLFPHQPRMLRDGDELCLGHLVMRVHFLNLESDLMR